MAKNSGRATIRDVARVADVSTATVSRYLNGKTAKMTDATAQRIQIAIEKLKYVPNFAAREMNHNASKMIAVVIANIEDYFSIEIFRGASATLEANGYIAVLLDANSQEARERQLLASVNKRSFDGLVFQPLTNEASQIAKQATRDFPIVIVDRKLNRSPWPQVVTNNFTAAKNATTHFIDKGFDNFIVISSTISQASTRRDRYAGIKDSLTNSQTLTTIEIDEQNYDLATVIDQVEAAIDPSKRNVLFSLKERWLLDLLPVLMRHDRLDPNKTAVTGFADTELINSICPFAQMVSQKPYLMGQQAAIVLLEMLKKPDAPLDDEIIVDAVLKD